MDLSSYFGILIAFAIGYVIGTITTKLLKFAIGIILLIGAIIGIYIYFLR